MKKAQKMPSYIAVRDSQYELKNASDSSTGFNDSEKNINLVLNGYYQLCIAIVEPTM